MENQDVRQLVWNAADEIWKSGEGEYPTRDRIARIVKKGNDVVAQHFAAWREANPKKPKTPYKTEDEGLVIRDEDIIDENPITSDSLPVPNGSTDNGMVADLIQGLMKKADNNAQLIKGIEQILTQRLIEFYSQTGKLTIPEIQQEVEKAKQETEYAYQQQLEQIKQLGKLSADDILGMLGKK